MTQSNFFAAAKNTKIAVHAPARKSRLRTFALGVAACALMSSLMIGCTSAPISGNGSNPAQAARLEVTPSSISFSSGVVGQTSSQSLKLSNTGGSPLTVSEITATGAGLSITGFSGSTLLNPGTSSTFGVQINPKSAGAISGSVSVVSTTKSLNTTLPVTGEAAAAKLAIAVGPSSLNFGTVKSGTTASESVTLTNTGNAEVTVSKISVSGKGFGMSGGNPPIKLASSQSATVQVEFAPPGGGAFSGALTVQSNASESSVVVKLAGTEGANGPQSASHSVGLTWEASTTPSISGYNVYRANSHEGPFSKVNGGLIDELNFTDTTVNPGDTYYYVTTAVNSHGEESAYSNEAKAIVP